MNNELGNEYAWLGSYEKTWEALQEDEHGSLEKSVANIIQKAKRQQMMGRLGSVQIGMVRHVVVIIDGSAAMFDQDLRPNRLYCTIKVLEGFVEEFFNRNPVSQLSFMVLKNKRCELLTDLTGNSKIHLRSLAKLSKTFAEGDASLYNGIDQAFRILRNVPGHVSREILIIFGSLSTIDPFDINPLIKDLKTSGVKCSIVGLSASIHVCQKIAEETKGSYKVCLDEHHLKALVQEHLLPPISPDGQESSQMKMGFPQLNVTPEVKLAMCMCHLESTNMKECFGKGGYLCPQCSCKYCELPVECVSCGLMLVSSTHLARSYLHLFPLEAFQEVPVSDVREKNKLCYGCQKPLNGLNAYRCKKCLHCFCCDCDNFIHDSLHNCPGCASRRNQ